ncbi:MAG: cytochrome P450, partial [Ktedonobacterales bacterium]|nr:cytochrome P450 [Ktedonobacterales bacterium]
MTLPALSAPVAAPRRQILDMLIRRDPLRSLAHLKQRYGDRVRLAIGNRTILLLSHPDDIRQVLVAQPQAFTKPRIRGENQLTRLLGNGLLTSEGEYHHQQRLVLQPAFHRQHLATYAEAMVRAANEEGATWQDGATLDIAARMQQLTLRIVGETLFGTRID